MEVTKKKLKVYCETSFVSWLVSRPSTVPDHAVKQAYTRKWWNECAPLCELFASGFVIKEAAFGDADRSALRLAELMKFNILDGEAVEISTLASRLLATHAVPEKETADAFHIATAAVYGMDILLTWNCKHMANLITLPKTASVIAANGYECPKILTPKDALEVEYD